jgi:hypothetical protein
MTLFEGVVPQYTPETRSYFYTGVVVWYSLFGDSENRGTNYLKIRDLLSIVLFNILGTHYSIHI